MRISGLASGMDTEQMINDIMAAQRIPVDRVYQQKVKAEWKRDAYRDINTKLLRFRNIAFDMTLQGTFQKNEATVSHSDILSASATGKAQAGSYELMVQQLAKSAQYVTGEVDLSDRPNSFQIRGIDGEIETINVEDVDTLDDLVEKINANKNLGISAFQHGGKVSFTTKATGAEAKFEVDENFTTIFGGKVTIEEGSTTEDGTVIKNTVGTLQVTDKNGVEQEVTGQNAIVKINGLEVEYGENNFEFNGININLREAQENTTVRVEVRQDVDAVVDKIKEFVELYNELVDEFNASTREDVFRDFHPLTQEQRAALSDKEIEQWEEKAKSGLLRSDPILGSVLSEMRMALGAAVEGLEGNKSLAQIGIKTGAWYEYGRLTIDEDKLRASVEEDPEGVTNIFNIKGEGTADTGIARRLTTALDNSMERITRTAGSSTTLYDQSFLGEEIRNYESRLDQMEERLIRFEENQWKKFTAMERVLSQLYAQGDWLSQQLMTMMG